VKRFQSELVDLSERALFFTVVAIRGGEDKDPRGLAQFGIGEAAQPK
jgi:hypothetical protein